MAAHAPITPYVHREVPLDFGGRRLTFATSLGLFSSHRVDVGSHLLLRTLQPVLDGRERLEVLDVGCGYGTLGVALATLPAVASAHLVDRDALALDFARENAHGNAVEARTTFGASLGLDGVPEGTRYDLVVANVPGKAGDAVIASMLLDAISTLAPGGMVAVVVIEPIRDLVASTVARDDIEVTLRRDTADYSVFHYRPAASSEGAASTPRVVEGFASGLYDAGSLEFEDAGGEPLTIATVRGLPGYDRLDHTNLALMRRLPRMRPGARVAISAVGQGAVAASLLRAQREARFLLIDRDLLALRAARRALLALGCDEDRVETRHVGASDDATLEDARADLVVATLHEDAGAAVVEAEYGALIGALAPGGRAVIAGGSTAVTRLLARALPARMTASRTRHRGTSILEVTRAAS